MDALKSSPVSAQQIMRRRHWALIILRALALVMIIYGGMDVLWGLGTFFGVNGFSVIEGVKRGLQTFWDARSMEMFNPFWHGMAVLLPGIALACFDRRIVRWLVPVPQQECPQCGYALANLQEPRCPECGYELQSKQAQAE